MHVKSLSLDFSPELIPYDCFVHPNLICLPRVTSEKMRAEDSHASSRTVGTTPPLTVLHPPGVLACHFLQVVMTAVAKSREKYCSADNIESFTKNFSRTPPLFKYVVFRKICPSGSDSFALSSSEGGVVIPN